MYKSYNFYNTPYPEGEQLNDVTTILSERLPLTRIQDIVALKSKLAKAIRGDCFIIQAGDCAESIKNWSVDYIHNQIELLLQIGYILQAIFKKQIIHIGRLAGQYAKPRTSTTEIKGNKILFNYFGDMVNKKEFIRKARQPNPNLMLVAYDYSRRTLNIIDTLKMKQFGNLNLYSTEKWNLNFKNNRSITNDYQKISNKIQNPCFKKRILPTIFVSHEALIIPYEESLTRADTNTGCIYNLSTHLLWLGVRTAHTSSTQFKYIQNISNPIAVKIGPYTTESEIVRIVKLLNPSREPGRLTLIHRIGYKKINSILPNLIKAVAATEIPVLWICDPMHGNTEITKDRIKTRGCEYIYAELKHAFEIHNACNSYLGGIHLEITSENVTECYDATNNPTKQYLKNNYRSLLDPRLNRQQTLELMLTLNNIIHHDEISA